MTLFDIHNTLT